MNDIDEILDDCLEQISSGASTLDESLARHPEHSTQLRQLLQTALQVQRGSIVQPSAAFKSRTRMQLISSQTHTPPHRRKMPLLTRLAISFAAMLPAFFLVTGTAYAQTVLPGDFFYPWKITSEQAWRAFSNDPVSTDIALADRRVNEWIAVKDDPAQTTEALNRYLEVLMRLKSVDDMDTKVRILLILQAQQKLLQDVDLKIPELDEYLTLSMDLVAPQAVISTSP
jgi:hypothetical protein